MYQSVSLCHKTMKFLRFIAYLIITVAIIACGPTTEPEHKSDVNSSLQVPIPRISIGGVYDGQLVESDSLTLSYTFVPETEGNVAVLYVDNGDPQPLPGLEGEYEVTNLEPGVHAIQIKEMTSDFEHTGYFNQVNFIVQ